MVRRIISPLILLAVCKCEAWKLPIVQQQRLCLDSIRRNHHDEQFRWAVEHLLGHGGANLKRWHVQCKDGGLSTLFALWSRQQLPERRQVRGLSEQLRHRQLHHQEEFGTCCAQRETEPGSRRPERSMSASLCVGPQCVVVTDLEQ